MHTWRCLSVQQARQVSLLLYRLHACGIYSCMQILQMLVRIVEPDQHTCLL